MHFTDDPVRDFYRYDAECAEWENKRPKCAFCGEPIVEEKCYSIFDCVLCCSCIEECKHDTEDFMKKE